MELFPLSVVWAAGAGAQAVREDRLLALHEARREAFALLRSARRQIEAD
jgi:hypothetical protein